jgi:hypothetical protein
VAPDKYLSIYLNDHLAGAVAAVELARRIELDGIADEIDEDRRALLDIMTRLDVDQDRIKMAVSWAAEKVGRLKLNGELLRSSPLSRLEELELLGLGVEGKLALWRTLRQELAADARLDGVELDALITRAQSQRRRIERLRLQAARTALGG